eukprot:scaffold1328_cov162-Amphora_coffeaeformis.AAC.10
MHFARVIRFRLHSENFVLHPALWAAKCEEMRRKRSNNHHYRSIMVSQREKVRFSSFRKLICYSNKGRDEEEDDHDDDEEREYVPMLTISEEERAEGTITRNFTSGVRRMGGPVDLDESIVSDEGSYIKRPSNDSVPFSRPENKKGAPKLPTRSLSTSRKKSHAAVAKHWHGDGGDDQPTFTPVSRMFPTSPWIEELHSVPLVVTTSSDEIDSGRMSPETFAYSLGLDLESLGDLSLMKRVEVVKARAEQLLMEAQQHKSKSNNYVTRLNGATSAKSFASVLTEPTTEGTDSASSNCEESLSEKIKRLQHVHDNLQRFSDEQTETSSIGTESPLPKSRGSHFRKPSDSSLLSIYLDSRDSGITHPGSKMAAETGDVLRILSMLEAINGYDLSIDDTTMELSAMADFNMSFLDR